MNEAKDWNKLTIAMLKQELANRNLDVLGKKTDLISRLEKSEQNSKENFALGDGPGLSENNKHDDSTNATGEEFSVDDLQLVDEFVDDDYLEEEEKMEGLDNEDGKPDQLKTYDVDTLNIPKVNEMHKDLQVAQKFRVLYIYPLRTEMMADPAIQIHFLRCSSVLCKFYPTETPDGYVSEGYVILRFEFSEDALTAMEELTNILPRSVNIKVRQLGQTHMHVLSGIIRTEPKGVEIWLKDNKNTKVVFVGNLPPTATEAALKEIFTGATIIRIAREDDSSSKGYAIVGYDNAKDAEQAAEEHSSAILDNYVLAVFHFPSAPRPRTAEKEQTDKLKKLEHDQKQKSIKSEEPLKKESGVPQMKKGTTPLKKSGVTPLKQEKKATPQQVKNESTNPQDKHSPAIKKPVGTPKEEATKKESVTPNVKKETQTSRTTEKNGQAGKKTDVKPAAGTGSKLPAAGVTKTGNNKQAGGNGRLRRGPQPTKSTQRYPQGRGGNNSRPGFATQRRIGPITNRIGMRGNQMQQQRPLNARTQKRQGLWEQALERRQEQRTGDTMQRQSSFGNQQFGNKRQFPYSSSGLDDKRRRMGQTPYGNCQSSYEPRTPSLLDMSITKRMVRQMSSSSGFQQGGSGMGQGVGGMGMGGGIIQGDGYEQGGGVGMRGGMGQDMGMREGMEQGDVVLGGGMDRGGMGIGGGMDQGGMDQGDQMGFGGGMVQDRGMTLQDRGMMGQDRGMMGQDRGMMGQDRGMMVHERGLVHDRLGVKVEPDMGMVQGGGMYLDQPMQLGGQMGYGGGNQGRMQSNIIEAGEMDRGRGGMDQGPGGMSQGSGMDPSSGTVNLLLGLTQMLSNQLPQQRQMRRRSRGNMSFSRGTRGSNRGGPRVGGARSTRGYNSSRR